MIRKFEGTAELVLALGDADRCASAEQMQWPPYLNPAR